MSNCIKCSGPQLDDGEPGKEDFSLCYAPATGLEAGTHPPGLQGWPTRSGVPAGGHTPPLGPSARPPAGAPRPHLLPLPHPRGRAPRSAARLPGSRRAAATAAPARQPAPRRAHGARAPHFLSPKPRPADHSPGQSPAAAAAVVTGEAWRWDRSGAPHKGTGRGPERQEDRRTDRRTDKHGTRGRSSGAAGAVMGPAHRGLLVNRKMHSPTHHTCVPQDTMRGQVACEERKESLFWSPGLEKLK
ncbi:translation initiation factor IF-2-like [Mustela putorius furo]|uniref:Translation initiation factor IF-2-like n=1 Tax=Mustela putorius furo TaxID=9669 RepID=A0A8U0RT93_MUSPF|nr:translation initiation factor IF-2-like [Mustela putorius furo]